MRPCPRAVIRWISLLEGKPRRSDPPLHRHPDPCRRGRFRLTPVSIAVGTSAGDYTEHWTGTATEGDILLGLSATIPRTAPRFSSAAITPPPPHVNGEVRYELTGQEDLMLTDERSGSLSRRFDATETPLIHKHLLTQLSFRLRVKGAPDGYSVNAVKLNGLASVAKVSLSDGEVVRSGRPAR